MLFDVVYICVGINGVIFCDDVWDWFYFEYVDEDYVVFFLFVYYCDFVCGGVFFMGLYGFIDDLFGFVLNC